MKTNLKLADAYYRLSVEEANGGESSSITNQRSIVRQYCEDNGITIVKEFVDDGFSGSNFDRPGFSQMIAHLKNGLANMVITKDLSRLGRDMTESSYYAETYFPENQIHYIAISDERCLSARHLTENQASHKSKKDQRRILCLPSVRLYEE